MTDQKLNEAVARKLGLKRHKAISSRATFSVVNVYYKIQHWNKCSCGKEHGPKISYRKHLPVKTNLKGRFLK